MISLLDDRTIKEDTEKDVINNTCIIEELLGGTKVKEQKYVRKGELNRRAYYKRLL